MNITCGFFEIKDGFIHNKKTGEFKAVKNIPSANTIAYMDLNKCMQCCEISLQTGNWPQ
jgi:hypothetical protein